MIFCIAWATIYAWMAWELWPREKAATAICVMSSAMFLYIAS